MQKGSGLARVVLGSNGVLDDSPAHMQVPLFARGAFSGHLKHCLDKLFILPHLIYLYQGVLVRATPHQLNQAGQILLDTTHLLHFPEGDLRLVDGLCIFLQGFSLLGSAGGVKLIELVLAILAFDHLIDLILFGLAHLN